MLQHLKGYQRSIMLIKTGRLNKKGTGTLVGSGTGQLIFYNLPYQSHSQSQMLSAFREISYNNMPRNKLLTRSDTDKFLAASQLVQISGERIEGYTPLSQRPLIHRTIFHLHNRPISYATLYRWPTHSGWVCRIVGVGSQKQPTENRYIYYYGNWIAKSFVFLSQKSTKRTFRRCFHSE